MRSSSARHLRLLTISTASSSKMFHIGMSAAQQTLKDMPHKCEIFYRVECIRSEICC